jgi:hypothetical protein
MGKVGRGVGSGFDFDFPIMNPLIRPVWTLCREEFSLTAAGWASSSIEGRIAVEYFDPSPEVQASKYAFRAHRQTVDGADHVFPINAIAYHPM